MSERVVPVRAVRGSRRATGIVLVACGVIASALSSASCAGTVNLREALQVTELSGGYFDAGIVEGKNKLQPSISFRIHRQGERPRTISLNVIYRKIAGNELQDFDEVFLQTVAFEEGNRTALITARTQSGYTGDPPQSRADMLKNSQFQDMRAFIFAKQSSSNWVELATYDLPRQVLTR